MNNVSMTYDLNFIQHLHWVDGRIRSLTARTDFVRLSSDDTHFVYVDLAKL